MKIYAPLLALLLSAAPSITFAGGSVEAGKGVYEKRCVWCHGETGAGDGPASSFLSPPPRDFTAGVYKWKSTPFDEMVPSDEDFMRMIKGDPSHNGISGWTGMNGTSMPGWSDILSDKDAADVTAYIKKFAELGTPQKPAINTANAPKSTKEGIERGKKIFENRCAECHGREGKGSGTKKLKDDWGARTWPRNLTKAWSFRVGNDVKDIYTRVTVGIPGTQMPSFADPGSNKKLSDEERWDAAVYVNSLDAPRKKPTDNTVIKAMRIEGALPDKTDDPAWNAASVTSFYLVPQIIAQERHFTPSLDTVSVGAVYNSDEIAILLEWDDRTRSLPGDAKAIEIADGDVFVDGVAVQWPRNLAEGEKPYFGMGDAANPVNVWFWQSESAAGAGQTVRLLDAKGFKDAQTRDPASVGLKATGVYDNGTWRVVMKRALTTKDAEKDIQFSEGKFIPIAFAAWDGSNQEKGSKHVMTTWHWLLMQPATKSTVYVWPIVIGLVIAGVEFLWWRSARKKRDTGQGMR
ncbi:MAG: c-type cytochrome [Deltaproteobacteria bacterium]|nr:c-type cytochrome [Deltaproteobacteria bacterium]